MPDFFNNVFVQTIPLSLHHYIPVFFCFLYQIINIKSKSKISNPNKKIIFILFFGIREVNEKRRKTRYRGDVTKKKTRYRGMNS